MRKLALLIACLTGIAAVASPAMAQGYGDDVASAYIEISQGNQRHLESLRIYADDRMERRVGGPRAAISISDGASGIYTRMARFLANEGPALAQNLNDAPVCPDWGEIIIRAEPAVAGVSFIRAGCPDSGIEPLRDELLVIAGR